MSPVHAGIDLQRLEPLAQRLQHHYIDTGRIAGCQWLVARHGQVVQRRSLGLMDAERGVPMRDDAVFRLYSMTKPITSVALMMLFEQGHFGLNDPVSNWLPGWRDRQVWAGGEGSAMRLEPPRTPITFRHLLNHSSGLTYGAALLAPGEQPDPVDQVYRRLNVGTRNGDSLETLVNKLGRVPLRFHPGEAWCYSFATDVCGHLVERISGLPLERYLHERIFAPLAMRDTGFAVRSDQTERLTALYAFDAERGKVLTDDPQRSAWSQPPALHSGGGGLVGTLADYARFCELLRRGGELDGVRLIGPRTLAMMRINHLPGDQDLTQRAVDGFSETAQQGVGFGLGFATTLGEARAGVPGGGDFYWGGLASTTFWVDPREDLVVIFLTQLTPSRTYDFRGLCKSVVYGAMVDQATEGRRRW